MESFVQWIEDHGFMVSAHWDEKTQKMAGPGRLFLFPHQKRILGHCLTPDENGDLPYETIIYSTIKKSGKTTIGAAVVAWYMDQAPDATEGYVIANSADQAEGRVMSDLKFHLKHVKANAEGAFSRLASKAKAYRVDYENDSFVQTLAQNNAAAAGSRHAITSWDELWGARTEDEWRMWEEMTPINTIHNSLRFVSTYAGYLGESKVLEDLYKSNIGDDDEYQGPGQPIPGLEDLPCWRNGKTFIYWDHEPRFPWQTQEYYDEQAKSLRPGQYLRLHENRWVNMHEAFIPIEWWRFAETARTGPIDLMATDLYKDYPVVIGIDAAPKHDCTALVAVTYDSRRNKLIQLTHRIWTPNQVEQMDFEATVESYVIELYNKLNVINISYDPAHLHQTMMRLAARGLPVTEFVQSVNNMVKASQGLYNLLKYQQIESYPDEEMESHIVNAIAKQEPNGFRLVKDKRNRTINKPMDAAIAIAIASYVAVSRLTVSTGDDVKIEAPFSDVSGWKTVDPDQAKLPYMFRED